MALHHFHERVDESPRSYENFGTSGSKRASFVSEIWPFEVGIAVRPNSSLLDLGSVQVPSICPNIQGPPY